MGRMFKKIYRCSRYKLYRLLCNAGRAIDLFLSSHSVVKVNANIILIDIGYNRLEARGPLRNHTIAC